MRTPPRSVRREPRIRLSEPRTAEPRRRRGGARPSAWIFLVALGPLAVPGIAPGPAAGAATESFLVAEAGTFPSPDPPVVSPEYEVKAAFLYKFIYFTDWPEDAFPDAHSPIIVQVVGEDPFAGQLSGTFKGKEMHGRKFVVRSSVPVPESIDAHVLFAGGLSEKARATLLERSRKRPVLLVGDRPGFAAAGALVNMYLEKGKVRFEINPDAAKEARLKLSSQLLKLARIVHTRRDEESR